MGGWVDRGEARVGRWRGAVSLTGARADRQVRLSGSDSSSSRRRRGWARRVVVQDSCKTRAVWWTDGLAWGGRCAEGVGVGVGGADGWQMIGELIGSERWKGIGGRRRTAGFLFFFYWLENAPGTAG